MKSSIDLKGKQAVKQREYIVHTLVPQTFFMLSDALLNLLNIVHIIYHIPYP